MRLTLWIIPTIAFVAAAACIVQREAADDSSDPTVATVETDAVPAVESVDSIPPKMTQSVQIPDSDFAIQSTISDFESLPPGEIRQPVWKITDHAFSGDVLAPSDVPVLAISNTQAVEEPAVPVQIAANDREKSASPPPWEVIGHSVGGIPIHIRRYGTTGDLTLIVCGLDGNDRIAVKWLDELSRQLNDTPELVKDRRVVLLRDPNPDGLTVKQAVNKHGVMLNRNFPSTNYRPGENYGPGPASEPETRAVLEVLYRFQPQRVVYFESAGKSEISANKAAQPLAELLGKGRQIPTVAQDQPPVSGSLEEFASLTFGAEVITLRLSTGDDWRSAAITHFPTLLAAAIPSVAQQSLSVASVAAAAPVNTDEGLAPSPFGNSSAEIVRLERSGYEELPPPPHKPTW